MANFIKKHKLLIIIVCSIAMVTLGIFSAVKIVTAPEVDRYCHPALIGGTSREYMRIRLDEAEQNANEEIVLTVNTAFCESLMFAECGLQIRLYYWGSNVFDAVYPGAEKYTMTEEEHFNLDFTSEYDYYILELPHESVNPKDLVFRSNSDLIRKLVPSVVPYEFQIPLTVREDAPYEDTGVVYIYMSYYAEGDLTNDQVWDDHYSSRADGSIYFYKIGDQIYFSDESIEDAKKLA